MESNRMIIQNNEKVRGMIIALCLYISLMLFQTPVMSLGMLTAVSTIALVIFSCLFTQQFSFYSFKLTTVSITLVLFLFQLVVSTLLVGSLPSSFMEIAAMMLLCIIVCGVTITPREDRLLRWTLVLSATVYAVLTIRSCIEDSAERYYHGNIRLFGTEFDPNYIGLPFVAASALLLDHILKGTKRFLSILCYAIIIIAIVYTSSRGNFISLAVSNGAVILCFLADRSIANQKKLIWIGLTGVLLLYFMDYLSTNFQDEWERMTVFGEGSDNGRFDLWENSLALWQNNPIMGIGLNGMYRYVGMASHNTYLQILTETGLLGFAFIGIFAVCILHQSFHESKSRFCVLLGLFVQIAFLDALDSRCVWGILSWCVLMRTVPENSRLQER